MAALLPEGETGATALSNSGFTARSGVTYYEKLGTVSPRTAEVMPFAAYASQLYRSTAP